MHTIPPHTITAEEAATAALAALSLGDKDGQQQAPPPLPTTATPTHSLGLEDLAISPLEFFAEECANEEDALRRLEAYRRIRYVLCCVLLGCGIKGEDRIVYDAHLDVWFHV
jgi:hypothetical protein